MSGYLILTAQQYGEWGNPNIADELKVMQQYDPYLNLSEQITHQYWFRKP